MKVTLLQHAARTLAGVVAGALVALSAGSACAQAKKPLPGVGIAAAPAASAAEIVGKLLAPGASDPDVPLPHPDLSGTAEGDQPLRSPKVFGRGEPGGGVLGVRVPFPVDRSGSADTTRYSPPAVTGGTSAPGLSRLR